MTPARRPRSSFFGPVDKLVEWRESQVCTSLSLYFAQARHRGFCSSFPDTRSTSRIDRDFDESRA